MLQQARAQARFDCEVGGGLAVTGFIAGGDSSGLAGGVAFGTVLLQRVHASRQHRNGQDATDQQAIERAHANTPPERRKASASAS